MSRIPEEIARFRERGVEIKKVGKNYYAQRVTSRWDKEAQKVRKVYQEYIGMVDTNGIHSAQTRRVKSGFIPYSKEFGATWLLRELSKDIYTLLRKHFGNDADWIYASALLRCVHHSSFKYLEHQYTTSYLSDVIPNLHLSSQNMSNLMAGLGFMRVNMVSFMKEFIPVDHWYAIFDGTSIICNSQNISDAQRGYNSHGCHDPQLNLMYAISLKKEELMPVFYKRYPGSIRDVSAFQNMAAEMGIKTALLISDKGFTSSANSDHFEKKGLLYIMPLKRSSKEFSTEPLQCPGFTGFHGRFKYNGRIVWYYEQAVNKDDKHRYFLYLDETLQHMEMNSRHTKKIGKESENELKNIVNAQLMYGTFALKTNMLDRNAIETYKTFKTREDVEQLFDLYKSESDFATTGMHNSETCEATLFLNHLCIMMAYRVYNRLKENGSLKEYAIIKVLDNYLRDIRVSNDGCKWQLEPIPKAARLTIEAMGMNPPDTVQ